MLRAGIQVRRINSHMLSDSAAPVLLTQTAVLERLPEHNATVICLDENEILAAVVDLGNDYDVS